MKKLIILLSLILAIVMDTEAKPIKRNGLFKEKTGAALVKKQNRDLHKGTGKFWRNYHKANGSKKGGKNG